MKTLAFLRSSTYEIFMNVMSLIYGEVFHKKISTEIELLLRNLSYVFTGTMIATVLSFIYNIYAGRILGPTEYGKFTLIQSIAMFLQIQMLLGFSTAMVKYNSEKIDYSRQKNIISTTYAIVFMFTSLTSSIYFLGAPIISEILSVPVDFIYLSIIFAVFFVFHNLTTRTLQGLHEMKLFSAVKPLFSTVLIVSFLLLIDSANMLSFKSMIISTYLANIIVGGFILINVRKYITFKPNRSWAKTLSKYSIFMVFAEVSFIIHTNIDKIFINKYLIIADVGLYNAYYYASINVITILMGIFIATLFPIICKSQNKKIIFENINKLLPIIIIVGLPLIIISQHIIIRIYGDEYIIRTSLIMLFAITSVIIAFFRLYTWTFNSVGIEGAKLNLLGNGTIAIVNILLNIYLIPHFGLEGAISATLISYTIGMCFIYINSKKIMLKM